MKAFKDMTKQEIVENFNNRWKAEGYRDAISKLAEVGAEAKATGRYEAFFELSEAISEEFGQGLNTVVADAHRL